MVGNDSSKMISIKISMEVESKTSTNDIFADVKAQKTDNSNTIITTELLTENDTLSFDGNQFVEFLMTFSVGVASGVVGNYIYNAIHATTKKLEINGRRTRLTEESISQAIETIKEMVAEKELNDKDSEEK